MVILMKATGIIVEYNPLHNGHVHHIKETKRHAKPDCLIAVMSGSFTQRGEPAITDKFSRAEMAIKAGVDLVIELPFVHTVQNADYFAYSSMSILDKLNVKDVYFGSESGDINQLTDILNIMESTTYNTLVNQFMKNGHSYPTSNQMALEQCSEMSGFDQPNNILGIQYIKAKKSLKSSIQLRTIKRIESGYYDEIDASKSIQSATSIRQALIDHTSIDAFVPPYVQHILNDHSLVVYDDFTEHLKYVLNTASSDDLKAIFNMTEGFEHRLLNHRTFSTVTDLINQVITKRYTYSAIKRTLAHTLCQTPKDLIQSFDASYIRVLGMNINGKDYLSTIKNQIDIPIITNVKEGLHPYLDMELKVSRIYGLVTDKDVFKESFDPTNVLYFD